MSNIAHCLSRTSVATRPNGPTTARAYDSKNNLRGHGREREGHRTAARIPGCRQRFLKHPTSLFVIRYETITARITDFCSTPPPPTKKKKLDPRKKRSIKSPSSIRGRQAIAACFLSLVCGYVRSFCGYVRSLCTWISARSFQRPTIYLGGFWEERSRHEQVHVCHMLVTTPWVCITFGLRAES